MRGAEAAEGPAGFPHPRHGRFNGDPSLAIATTDARRGEPGERLGKRFLTRGPQTLDIFVHMETLRRFGFTELRPGQIVLVRYGRGPKGLMAAELKPDTMTGPSSH